MFGFTCELQMNITKVLYRFDIYIHMSNIICSLYGIALPLTEFAILYINRISIYPRRMAMFNIHKVHN